MPLASAAPPRTRTPRKRGGKGSDIAPEAILTVSLLMLICIGVVMVYSTSSAAALLSDESPQGLLVRQGIYAVIGLIVFAACARLSPSRLVAIGKPAMIVSIAALVVPAGILPGHRMRQGTRRPPSQTVPFPSRNTPELPEWLP